jgi:CMP-N-acetylneuraminic acid synthetase
VAQIVVDTDSPIIWEGVEATFPEVRLIKRPEPLRGGEVPTNDVIRHDLSQTDAEFYLQTHCTNPLLRSQTVSQAVHAFFASRPEHDSLFSVTRYQKRLWDARTRPVNHDPRLLLRTQDLEPLFEENSCLYIFERSTFLKHNNRLGERPWMFEIEAIEAWDIDEEWDFLMAQSIMAHRGGGMKRPNLG